MFVLCSDGLSGQVADEEIGCFAATLPPEEAAAAMQIELIADVVPDQCNRQWLCAGVVTLPVAAQCHLIDQIMAFTVVQQAYAIALIRGRQSLLLLPGQDLGPRMVHQSPALLLALASSVFYLRLERRLGVLMTLLMGLSVWAGPPPSIATMRFTYTLFGSTISAS